MPPASPQPPRHDESPRRSTGPDHAFSGHGSGGPSQGTHQPTNDEGIAGDLAISMADFFAEALDGALALVHADGGELATLDSARQVLVLRARARHPRLSASLGSMGASGRPSQPVHPSLLSAAPGASHSGILRDATAAVNRMDLPAEHEIEQQSTILLPAALGVRTYRFGEGLIGGTWQRREPITWSGEEYRAQGRGASAAPAPGADAPWHLGVPIFRPGPLGASQTEAEVIGVIAVFNRDPQWPFSKSDIALLTLHADRVARSMRMAELARQNESRGELLEVLRTAGGSAPNLPALYPRVREVVRHLVDAPSFAVLLLHQPTGVVRQPSDPEARFELAERDGKPVMAEPRPASRLPAWWHEVGAGRCVRVSAPEERAATANLMTLGWGDDRHTPVHSLLAAPLMSGSQVLGAIVAGSPNPDAYAPEHQRLIETVAHAAAIIIENAQLSQSRERARQLAEEKATNLAVLNNAVLTLNASLDLDATLCATSEQAVRLTSAQACAVFLLDPQDKYLVWQTPKPNGTTVTGTPGPAREVRIPLSWHGLDRAMASQQFLVLDKLEDEWHDRSSVGKWLADWQITSCLVLPMERPDHTQDQPVDRDQRQPSVSHLGVLLVFTPGRRQPFSPAETGLLHSLASQAAIAISNAKLYEDLKTLDRLKDDFILTVSHEFRTPLTTINGYVSLIGRHADRLDKARLEQYGHEIRMATDQLAGMIATLADVNRMDSAPLHLEPVPVEARAAAEKAVATCPPESKERVTNEVPDNLWVNADAERLPTVFSNLVSNALKYGSESAPCRITARTETREALLGQGRKLPHAAAAHARWAVLGVRDFGAGIAQEDQHRLFHKFVRLPQTLTTSVRGTGLGLWICKQYITAMGGDIWVESGAGHGAHFQFCLPIVSPPAD
ncbi:MAG: GAF domain-containing protein [Ktedonobacterales bacterium]|nr:GAF domain-containing protein [Ktedonobacterales bacterium]